MVTTLDTCGGFAHTNIPVPSSIRLLPYSVDSYQDFRDLHRSRECEECAEGSLFYNYYEIVHYPNPGPCDGTSGSQVRSCPYHPNSEISLKLEERRKPLRKNIKCKMCSMQFLIKANLNFHLSRKLWNKRIN